MHRREEKHVVLTAACHTACSNAQKPKSLLYMCGIKHACQALHRLHVLLAKHDPSRDAKLCREAAECAAVMLETYMPL